MSTKQTLSLAGLVVLMVGSGVLHLVSPEPYRRIVPRFLGHADALVLWSGVAELICGILLLIPATRRAGGWATVALLVAVFPANIQMAVDGGLTGSRGALGSPVVAWLRLPIQPLLIWWAYGFTRA